MDVCIGKAVADSKMDGNGWAWLVNVMLEGAMSRNSLDKIVDIDATTNKLNKLLIKKE